MRRPALFLASIIVVLASMACSGTMKGVDRFTGERVYFAYEDEKFGSASIKVVMPDGERFSGKTLDEPLETSAMSASGKRYHMVDRFPGKIAAYLTGDRGTNMKCKFRLSDPVLGFKGGGFGLCQTSDDRLIDVFTR